MDRFHSIFKELTLFVKPTKQLTLNNSRENSLEANSWLADDRRSSQKLDNPSPSGHDVFMDNPFY